MNALHTLCRDEVIPTLVHDGQMALAEKLRAALAAEKPSSHLLTSSEAAELLGVSSTNTIKNWLNGGSFPGAFQTPGGHWRFPEA